MLSPDRKNFFSCLRRARCDDSGVVSIEFAILSTPLMLLLLFVFELSLDLFQQEALDSALHLAARQMQTGNAQNVQSGADFISSYLCPDRGGLLSCNSIYLKVQNIKPTGSQDYYDYTTGTLPVNGNNLDLSTYSSGSFCNSGPSEFILVSAVYVSPTIIGHLMPNLLAVSYNGQLVHATLSTASFYSESYTQTAGSGATAPSC